MKRNYQEIDDDAIIDLNGQMKKKVENCDELYLLGLNYLKGSGGFEIDHSKAFDYFMKSAEQGCTKAQHEIGYFYHCGLVVEKDYSKSMEWYLKAAEKGFSESQFSIGILYGNRGDYSKAMEWYLKASENGNSKAQCNLACLYDSGLGVGQDSFKAMEWYLKAAENGNVLAQCNLGKVFASGKGVEKDEIKAFEWYLKAAENGDSTAQSHVAHAFTNGIGVQQNFSKAFEWYLKAAENPDQNEYAVYSIENKQYSLRSAKNAKYNVGFCYERGIGVEKNLAKAFEWYLKAANENSPNAQFAVATFYRDGKVVQRDFTQAVEWFLIASDNGHGDAQFNAGYAFENGLGLSRDYSKAMELYSKSAENGNERAMVNIGMMYQNGKGVEIDYSKAFEWLLKAAEMGDSIAQRSIGFLYAMGRGVEKNSKKSFEWYLKASENGDGGSQLYISSLYKNGIGVERNMKQSIFWKCKTINWGFEFIQDPYDNFALDAVQPSNENDQLIEESNEEVIIRFEKKDFKILKQLLYKCKYLTTMTNDNWVNSNPKEKNCVILDLQSIENEIFQENVSIIEIFEEYNSYLTSGKIPSQFDTKMKLLQLARYFHDDSCIFQIVKESDVLTRFYILHYLEKIEQSHIPITSCFIMDSSSGLMESYLSKSAIEQILNEIDLSPIAKRKLNDSYADNSNDRKRIFDDNNTIHIIFTKSDLNSKEITINNEYVTFNLEIKEAEMIISSSHDVQFFDFSQFYIQLNDGNQFHIGFKLLRELFKYGKIIFKLPNVDFTTIDLIVMLPYSAEPIE